MSSQPEVLAFTVHLTDGTHRRVEKGLLSYQDGADELVIHTAKLDVPDFLTLLGGLEAIAESILGSNPT